MRSRVCCRRSGRRRTSRPGRRSCCPRSTRTVRRSEALMGFWWTNRVANPVLRRLLRTAAGRRLGRGLLLLRYTGRRTGRPHEVVTQYARAENAVWVLVGSADRKTWWRNLRAPADVEVWLAGERLPAVAVAVVGAEAPGEGAAG